MRLVPTRSSRCEHARAWISLLADGELSDFERLRLTRHLRNCHECSAFMVDVGSVVSALRAAPLERPARTIELRQSHRPRLRRIRVVAPVAAALVLAVAGAVGSLSSFQASEPELLGVVGGVPTAVGESSRLVSGFRVTGRLVAQ